MAFLYEPRRGKPTVVVDKSLFKAVLNDKNLQQNILDYRQYMKNANFHEESGNLEEAKKWKTEAGKIKAQLPGWVFSAKEMVAHEWIDSKKKNRGVDHWRHQDWAIVNGLIMCDFDHLEDPVKTYSEHIEPIIPLWEVLFVFITPSGKGLKVVFKAMDHLGDIEENQKAFASAANLELDEVCKDASRLSFCTTNDDVLYLDEEIFDYENETFINKYKEKYFRGVVNPDMFGNNAVPVADASDSQVRGDVDAGSTGEVQQQNSGLGVQPVLDFSGYTYCGISPKDIISKLLADNPVKEGKRHDTLFQTAKLLRYVCERSDKKVEFFLRQLPWVQALDEEDHNVARTIADAMAKPYSSYLPKSLKSALVDLGYKEEERPEEDQLKPYIMFGKKLETFFDKFPCMAECCFGLEQGSYPAAIFVGAAFFGTLMTRTWYHYWFQPLRERRLNYCVIVVGDPGSGKSFAGDLYDIICEPIVVQDQLGTDAVNKYKKEIRRRNTSDKEKKKDPLVMPENIIRIHGTRTANGVFIEDMVGATDIVNGKPMHLHMLTFSAELDSMTQAQKGGQWIDKTSMELLAFHNEEDNQNYKNVDSVSGPFKVYWNFVYTGTPIALGRKVNERNFGSGLFSRLGCLPMGSDYYQCAEMRTKTKAEEARNGVLNYWAYELDKVQGELPLEPIVKDTHKYVQEIKELARLDDNKTEAFLVNRVPYYGINVAAPFILMRHWDEWQEKRTFKCDRFDIDLCRTICEIQMHSQRQFFGKYAEMYFDNSQRDRLQKEYSTKNTKSQDLFKGLPAEFTIDDIIKAQEMTVNAARILVTRWKERKMCEKISTKRGKEKWRKS